MADDIDDKEDKKAFLKWITPPIKGITNKTIDILKSSKSKEENKFEDEFKNTIKVELFIFIKKFSTIILFLGWSLSAIFIALLISYAYCAIFSYCTNETIKTALEYLLESIIVPIVTFVAGYAGGILSNVAKKPNKDT